MIHHPIRRGAAALLTVTAVAVSARAQSSAPEATPPAAAPAGTPPAATAPQDGTSAHVGGMFRSGSAPAAAAGAPRPIPFLYESTVGVPTTPPPAAPARAPASAVTAMTPSPAQRSPSVVGGGGEIDFARDRAPRHVAVWIQPVLPWAGPIAGYYNGNLGVNVSVSRGMDVVLQAGLGGQRNRDGTWESSGVGASLGAAFFLSGDRTMNGFFLQPRITYGRGTSRTDDPRLGNGSVVSASTFGVGLDLGYQITLGAIYIAPVIGFGGTFTSGNDNTDFPAVSAASLPLLNAAFSTPAGSFYPTMNLTGLRLGAAF